MAKPSAHKTHFSPNGGLIKKLGTHFRTPLPTASVSTLNSDQHLGVTIVVVVRRIIVAVFRVVVVAVLVPLRPDGQLMCHHHHQEEGDQDQQEADQDQTWPIKKLATKKPRSNLGPGSGVAKALAKTSTNAKFRCRRAFNQIDHYYEVVGVGDDADGGDGDAHHGWSGHPGGGVGGVTALSRCQLCLIYT